MRSSSTKSAAEKAPAREVGARARFMVGEVLFEQGNHKDAVRNFFLVAYGFSEAGARSRFADGKPRHCTSRAAALKCSPLAPTRNPRQE